MPCPSHGLDIGSVFNYACPFRGLDIGRRSFPSGPILAVWSDDRQLDWMPFLKGILQVLHEHGTSSSLVAEYA